MDSKETEEKWDHPAFPERQDAMVNQETRDQWDQLELQVATEPKENVDAMDDEVLMDPWGHLDLMVDQDHVENQEIL